MRHSVRSSPGSARPRFQTDIPPGTPDLAPEVAKIAGALKQPLMPWQYDAARIGTALGAPDPDTGIRPALFPYVVLHVPRRAGKSIVQLGAAVHRMLSVPGTRAWYTAQTRADAALTFRDSWSPLVRRSFLHPQVLRLRQSNGSESIRAVPTESVFSLFAPTSTALHGQDADTVTVDEAWTLSVDAGGELEAGIQPAQLTRPRRQLWIVSAGGQDGVSTWLARWMDLARDGTPGVAMIDYGAEPGDDLDDPAVIARVHPAVGHTITADAVLGLRRTMDPDEYARAVCGLWTPAATRTAAVLDRDGWIGCVSPLAPVGPSLAFGADVSADGSSASIVAAALVDGRTVVELVDYGPGWEWIPGRWRELRAAHRAPLYVDPLGPAAALAEALDRARLPAELVTTARYAAACETFVSDVRTGVAAHRDQPALTAAALTTGARALGERWVWDRKGGADSSPLTAATLAAAGARRTRARPSTTTAAG